MNAINCMKTKTLNDFIFNKVVGTTFSHLLVTIAWDFDECERRFPIRQGTLIIPLFFYYWLNELFSNSNFKSKAAGHVE